MDLDRLLQSHGDETPSGENLEYEPVFTDMELAAQQGEERQAGDEILPAEDPDFRDLSAKALAVMEQSHDLRAAVFLGWANLNTSGLTGFADVTAYIRRCLDEFWESCHPQLDADDDDDPTMRVNAIQALADPDTVLRSLRRAPLTESRSFGRMSMRDIAVAEGEIPPPADMETVPDTASVSAAFQDTDPDFVSAVLESARRAQEDVVAISAKFDEMTPGMGPDLDALIKLLRQMSKRVAAATGADEEPETEEAAEEAGAEAPAAARGPIGGVNSPTDVSNTLDRIIAYYERNEPSSPVPILLARAKRLVNADFVTIMEDMAPSGMDNVRLIGGLEE